MVVLSFESASEGERASATRAALLDSARELFTQKGYSAVSTRELAEKAGVNLGAIKYHFGSKARLFVETVVSLMAARKLELQSFFKPASLSNPEEAALALSQFVTVILNHMCHPEGPDACRMMHREINGATSQDPELYGPLVHSVTEQFIRPLDAYLRKILSVLSPGKLERQYWFFVHSIIGQCAYYVTHRPFAAELRGEDLVRKENIQEVAQHITEFSLRGLGVSQKLIQKVLLEMQE